MFFWTSTRIAFILLWWTSKVYVRRLASTGSTEQQSFLVYLMRAISSILFYFPLIFELFGNMWNALTLSAISWFWSSWLLTTAFYAINLVIGNDVILVHVRDFNRIFIIIRNSIASIEYGKRRNEDSQICNSHFEIVTSLTCWSQLNRVKLTVSLLLAFERFYSRYFNELLCDPRHIVKIQIGMHMCTTNNRFNITRNEFEQKPRHNFNIMCIWSSVFTRSNWKNLCTVWESQTNCTEYTYLF